MDYDKGTGDEGGEQPDSVVVGRIVSPWGGRGEVRVEVLTEFPERLAAGSQVFVQGDPFSIKSSQWHKGCLLIKLDEISSREEAEALRGKLMEVPGETVSPLPPDHYYYFQIVGLEVWTTSGEFVGEIASVLTTGANDVYVVRGPQGEVLIPAIEDVVKAVELDKGRMIIEPLAGLLRK